ncbi:chemotaxis response regulator protein-glutamate methylesterase [Coriobacteriia bacterium Es71-Z0120]|uniref:protein-glutamate methylesterase/protein-glutamine glutaminase n=1 Tax=Parvivirga hydrogeniphila TaxID=2939460 RepID=UPI002260F4E9|nr:chemotaxis response regulator protein-glutamate methylesterase [Parvivirga hydrogeniphila]MCL4078753.1 chemotaxis response regulator protein-glutamate methylesterase [Parvivirga hydrogeniphila]
MAATPVRVLVVDDSLVAREMLTQILQSDPGIEVVGVASNGAEAVEAVARLKPDLVTMDIHMPKMDGITAVEQIMAYTPTPILVVSSSVHGEGVGRAFDALAAGALEVMKKPEPRDWAELDRIAAELIRKVKLLSRVRVITHIRGRRASGRPAAPTPVPARQPGTVSLVAVGSSTGGPSALMSVLAPLPADFPVPIVIAQHIAEGFVPGLVSWLDAACKLTVRAAVDGETVQPGNAYLAPTGLNLAVDTLTLRFKKPGERQLYIPSADTLFESVAKTHGASAVGVLLTGMGDDGARGLKSLYDTGALTIAQDEATSTVFGMPKAAIEMGAARKVLPVQQIADALKAAVRA